MHAGAQHTRQQLSRTGAYVACTGVSLLLAVGATGGMRRNPVASAEGGSSIRPVWEPTELCLLLACVCLQPIIAWHAPWLQVWKVEDGSSNKREILKLNFPEAITPYFL